MAFATSGVIAPPRIPWRFLAVAALLVVLTLGGLLYTGAQRRLPAPFGRAENGLVAYGAGGDILTVDLATGARRADRDRPHDRRDAAVLPRWDSHRVPARDGGAGCCSGSRTPMDATRWS